jgi:CheY-like chemotaxis protein
MAVVLVVDDEYGIAKLIEDVLVDEGHRVLLASNGKQALERVAEERPTIVLTDFMMPVMDGAGLIKALAADATLADIPVVVMSSIPEAMLRERVSGYAHYLLKPFNIFDVAELVAQLDGAGS